MDGLSTSYGKRALNDPEYRAAELAAARKWLADGSTEPIEAPTGLPGVSVVIPSYNGLSRISTCLASLRQQTLRPAEFEIIVVVNGHEDGTLELIDEMKQLFGSTEVRAFFTPRPSAGGARNVGLAAARHRYVTFVDDDDTVERGYLEGLLSVAAPDRVAVAPIVDVDEVGTEHRMNALSTRIAALEREGEVPLYSVPWILGFNACKLIPTQVARRAKYSEALRSGEDLVFMAQLLAGDESLRVAVGTSADPHAYRRTLRNDSVSRQPLDFSFMVEQRLDVITELNRIEVSVPTHRQALTALVRAQAGFVRRYLDTSPSALPEVRRAVAERAINGFPWDVVNAGSARDLVIAYCFPPFMDTSAVVAAKIVAERGIPVDVITNDMSGIRRVDESLRELAGPWVDQVHTVHSRPAFADWPAMSTFAAEGLSAAERLHALKGGYRSVYSRALWAGSHVAAALFKLRHWNTRWIAEFSDPLRSDVRGLPRKGALTQNDVRRTLEQAIERRGVSVPRWDNLFHLIEIATFVLADELVFTNENQRSYMLDAVADRRLRRAAYEKSTVRPHPQPRQGAYKLVETSYRPPSQRVNLAYFGAFYENRGLEEVLVGLRNLTADVQRHFLLHIFCNEAAKVTARVEELGLSSVVKVSGYLPYLEFLNSLRWFDALIVTDTGGYSARSVNPFLPSKLSDYIGSGSPVWAIVEQGSALSFAGVTYRSPVGDSVRAMKVLSEIAARKSGGEAG